MEGTWDLLFDRIESDPPKHLGGFSPRLLGYYFSGYQQALWFHTAAIIPGALSLDQIGHWFAGHVSSANYAGVCLLVTDSDVGALELFFEFRRLARIDIEKLPAPREDWSSENISFLNLIQNPDAVRLRPAMYFGNSQWTSHLWAMWNGYVEAEKDIEIADSRDATVLVEFSKWLDERYPFAEGKNWGKLFQFLALDVHANALENFYDHLELFLDGGGPHDNTRRFQRFLDDAVESVKENERRRRESDVQ